MNNMFKNTCFCEAEKMINKLLTRSGALKFIDKSANELFFIELGHGQLKADGAKTSYDINTSVD